MWPESIEHASHQPLRTGLTTGSCATACALASARLLLTGKDCDACEIELPQKRGGQGNARRVTLPITACHRLDDGQAYASTVKDAGDDPDVTHGATVFTRTRLIASSGIHFRAAEGVGTVTRDGLALTRGEPAINPVPRRMIAEHLEALAVEQGYGGGFEVAIGVENGVALAQKTMNPRLGIIGGLSILGTTGIVRPFSCAAYIASIHQGIDVARANGLDHLAACTGNLSERYARDQFGLDDMALIEMGDFAGAVLKYLRRAPVAHMTLIGGFGKISKLAQGHLDLHSSKSSIDLDAIASTAETLGADAALKRAIQSANTSIEALKLAAALPLGDALCAQAWHVARRIVPESVHLDVVAIDRKGERIGAFLDSEQTS
ncbi:cobalt-precorrin-5B (C(1))-methyltransferase [Phytohalomonas tamaricis]|uniref:cobalt-precorrin-5B (C(1))-methyltransferase n=1 Tax=Phytohalomonas tamaricis TaxID=2081032 RepID=UPI000D0B2867|nr:cobalt-precorrin-5B (C(1))-methyltransferase [Phytohalomonas tamaricis]